MGHSKKGRTKIAAKVERKTVHPGSRKAKKLNHSTVRSDKLARQAMGSNKALYNKGVRLMWFCDHINQTSPIYTHDEAVALCEGYIARNDEELETLKMGKQTPSTRTRAVLLDQQRSTEMTELESGQGFQAPDMCDKGNLAFMREWDGSLQLVHKIKLTYYRKQRSA